MHDAYKAQATILAKCIDKKYRDGVKAVAAATRACELTDWKDFEDLSILAAAYTEQGDFPSAIKWQTAAVEQSPRYGEIGDAQRALLESYKAGKRFDPDKNDDSTGAKEIAP